MAGSTSTPSRRSSRQITLLTPGAFDVISIAGVDEEQGCVYFIASPDNPTQRYLYRAPLDGRGAARARFARGPAGHSFLRDVEGLPLGLSHLLPFWPAAGHRTGELAGSQGHPGAGRQRQAARQTGRVEALPQRVLPRGHRQRRAARRLVHQAARFRSRASAIRCSSTSTASRPGTTVVDRWGGETYLWHCLLAQQGYVVMSIDNRGTPAPRGREWRKCIYRQIGILASADQAAATRQILQERPYLDPERVGIWGWSGGGSMSLNAIFRYPDLYRTAMAIAFVSNQRFYDTIYQERYMGLPADNEAGFKNGSPITFAHQLKGNLLLVYGTGDDNCHYQNCEAAHQRTHQAQQAVLPDVLSEPDPRHQRGGEHQRHLFETLTRYLEENLPAGPRMPVPAVPNDCRSG